MGPSYGLCLRAPARPWINWLSGTSYNSRLKCQGIDKSRANLSVNYGTLPALVPCLPARLLIEVLALITFNSVRLHTLWIVRTHSTGRLGDGGIGVGAVWEAHARFDHRARATRMRTLAGFLVGHDPPPCLCSIPTPAWSRYATASSFFPASIPDASQHWHFVKPRSLTSFQRQSWIGTHRNRQNVFTERMIGWRCVALCQRQFVVRI